MIGAIVDPSHFFDLSVGTKLATEVTAYKIKGTGGVGIIGGHKVDAYGVQYRTIGGNWQTGASISTSSGVGSTFTFSEIPSGDLTPETTYDYRAWVRAGDFTVYGGIRTVTTTAEEAPPEEPEESNMLDPCGIHTYTHPRWGEGSRSYGTDNFGFGALPGGTRSGIGAFGNIGYGGYWWSSTEYDTNTAWARRMRYLYSNVFRSYFGKVLGFSVRCVKDFTGPQPDGHIYSNSYTDGSGNTYNAVVIGNQAWTTENLYATHYQNGTPIHKETDNSTWAGLTSGAYCWYDNGEATWGVPYGALYNWYAMSGLVDFGGFRVPTDADWTELTDYLIDKEWDNMKIDGGNVGQFLKSCRQVDHPLA